MNTFGEFLVYSVVNALLIEEVNFAYRVCSTDFASVTASILFAGNMGRFKALAAELIFQRYFDPKEPDSLQLVSYLIEAINAAREALELYSGEKDGSQTN